MKIDLKPNEQVIKAGNSKYMNGTTVDGKFILTNQRIYFKPASESDSKCGDCPRGNKRSHSVQDWIFLKQWIEHR